VQPLQPLAKGPVGVSNTYIAIKSARQPPSHRFRPPALHALASVCLRELRGWEFPLRYGSYFAAIFGNSERSELSVGRR